MIGQVLEALATQREVVENRVIANQRTNETN